jgi:hypothetical protein
MVKSKHAPKLDRAQHAQLLQWIAEGLTHQELSDLASQHNPPFSVSPQLHYFYRKSYNVDLEKLRDEQDTLALTTGLAIRAQRVKALIDLAKLLEDDLRIKELVWTTQVKGIGSGDDFERIEFEEFNAAEIQQLRGLYDDIAKETGGRVTRTDLTTAGKAIKGYIGISPDDWDEPASPKPAHKPKTKPRRPNNGTKH